MVVPSFYVLVFKFFVLLAAWRLMFVFIILVKFR